jgi:hypothetical protein
MTRIGLRQDKGKIHHGGVEDTEKNWAKVKSHHGFTRMTRIGLRQDKGKIHRSVAEDTRKNGQESKATTDLRG